MGKVKHFGFFGLIALVCSDQTSRLDNIFNRLDHLQNQNDRILEENDQIRSQNNLLVKKVETLEDEVKNLKAFDQKVNLCTMSFQMLVTFFENHKKCFTVPNQSNAWVVCKRSLKLKL